MDYLKHYNNLVTTRKETRNLIKENGYEIHHIIAKCMGGSNDNSNLVKLTYREHYIAHWLLIKIYPKISGIQYAFLCMLRDPHGNRKLTSRMVDIIKRNYSEFKKWHTYIVSPGKSEKSRKAATKRFTEANPMNTNPEKNHTSKKTTVYYTNGKIKIFKIKKELILELMVITNKTYSSIKYLIKNESNYEKFDILKIEYDRNIDCNDCIIGKKWYNDGVKNYYLLDGDDKIKDLIVGMVYKKRK